MVSLMTLFVVALLGVLLFTVPHLIWILATILGKVLHYSVNYLPFLWSAIGLVLLGWSVFAYGYYVGRFELNVQRTEYAHEDIPSAFDGYKIIQLSDLHLGTFRDHPDKLKDIISRVNSLEPDLVCFTGDLVSLGISEAIPFEELLRSVKAKDGVMSVLGNHDFLIYSRDFASEEEREQAVEELARFQREKLGWNLLRNEHHVVTRGDDTVTILGVDNQSSKNQGYRLISRGDLRKAMNQTDGFRILMSHDPTHWRGEVLPQTNIPLQLSGHTHSAQIRLLGWTPASWTFDETAGWYETTDQYGKRSLYINVGLGCTLPVRVGVDGEITVITLHH